jgi:tRNA 5-methylaminomethyl-2-thiouridine biosynthesis bifunctional protein
MAEPTAATLLYGCGLPQAWAYQSAWRILETRFSRGLNFLSTWRAWKNDPLRPRMLHYVSLVCAPPTTEELLACAAPCLDLVDLANELACQWYELLPGFHRLSLEGGQVLLTLCVGDLTTMLREQQFVADSVYLDTDYAAVSSWNIWTVKALVRCCRHGTRLASTADAFNLRADLTQCGFELLPGRSDPEIRALSGQFNPRWTVRSRRDPGFGRAVEVGTCAVIGAGLAGASVAAALARRGWQVQVLDQGEAPAAGASGLPAGLVVPHVSIDDCPLSRLSRSGVRLMLGQVRNLLQQGQDWDATGALERRIDDSSGSTDIWHSQAAWIKPAQLVRAWLAQAGVTFQGNAKVVALRLSGDQWELCNEMGQVLARTDRIVFANAGGASTLLETTQAAYPALGIDISRLPCMHGMRGQLSWAMHQGALDATFPAFPVNGAGSVIPVVPIDGGCAWYIGSSYQNECLPPLPDETNHAANLGRLSKLLPTLGQTLAQRFTVGPINAWKSTRCVTSDHLPAVGPVYQADHPTLWICAGMGSRGLSFSALCAELLAASWGAEPWPIASGLAQSLKALRVDGLSR